MVAILALVAAGSGAAVADPDAEIAVSKKKVKRIVDRRIDKRAPQLSVSHADTADAAGTAGTATRADTASNATSASRVNGVELRRFNFHASFGAPARQIFSGGGLTLRAECAAVGVTHVFATTSVPGSYLGSEAFLVTGPSPTDEVVADPFGPGNTVDLLASGSLDLVGHTGYFNRNGNVQLQWTAERNAAGCDFVGYGAIA